MAKTTRGIFESQLAEAVAKQRACDEVEKAFVKCNESLNKSVDALNATIDEYNRTTAESVKAAEGKLQGDLDAQTAHRDNADAIMSDRAEVNKLLHDKEFMNQVRREIKVASHEEEMTRLLGEKVKTGLTYSALNELYKASQQTKVQEQSLDSLIAEAKRNIGPIGKIRNIAKDVQANIKSHIETLKADKTALKAMISDMQLSKEKAEAEKKPYESYRVKLDSFQTKLEIEQAYVPYAKEMTEDIAHAADLASKFRAGYEELDAEATHLEVKNLCKERTAALNAQEAAMRGINRQIENLNTLYATKNEAIHIYQDEINKAREEELGNIMKKLGLNKEAALRYAPDLAPMSFPKAQAEYMKQYGEDFYNDVAKCEEAIQQNKQLLNQYKTRDLEVRARVSELVAVQCKNISKKDMERIENGSFAPIQIFRQEALVEAGIDTNLLKGMPNDMAKAVQLALELGVTPDFLNDNIEYMTPEAILSVAYTSMEMQAGDNKSALARVAKALEEDEKPFMKTAQKYARAHENELKEIKSEKADIDAYAQIRRQTPKEELASTQEKSRKQGLFARMINSIKDKTQAIGRAAENIKENHVKNSRNKEEER